MGWQTPVPRVSWFVMYLRRCLGSALGLSIWIALTLAGCGDGDTRPGGDAGGPGPIDGAVGRTDGAVGMTDGGTTPEGCAPPPAATCAVIDTSILVPLDVHGATVGESDDFGGSTCGVGRGGGMGGTGAKDIAFRFTAPEAGLYEITTVGSDFDTLLSIRDGCEGAELVCNDDIARGTTQSSVELMLAECQTIVIVVDGYNAMAEGNVTVTVTTHETACDDGVDNDGDGLSDCDDLDCFSLECNPGDDWPLDWQRFEFEVLMETNRFRAMGYDCDTEGVFGPAGPLEMDALIREAARGHSLDMGEQNFFDHNSLDGRTFSDRMRNVGFSGGFPWGENIAAGQSTPVEVVQGWMESDGHCSNIMNPAYHVIGIGYALVEGSRFGHYWTQDFAGSH